MHRENYILHVKLTNPNTHQSAHIWLAPKQEEGLATKPLGVVPKPRLLVGTLNSKPHSKIMKISLWKLTMSDDEDSAPVVKKQRIQFGSLEAVERERLAAGPSNDNDDKEDDDEHEEAEGEDIGVSAAVLAGIRAGNINISEGKRVTIILQLYISLVSHVSDDITSISP